MPKMGYTLMTEQAGPKDLVRWAARAEEAGFDLLVSSDHYFPWLDEQGHAKSTGPVRFAISGLILTPISVMARAIPADAAADDLVAIFDAALHAEGCYEAGSTPALWYVNLVYFTGPVSAADDLAAWTDARQQMKVTDVRVTEMRIARWRHTTTGMMPVVLASASLL
jgi:hypothetical protein